MFSNVMSEGNMVLTGSNEFDAMIYLHLSLSFLTQSNLNKSREMNFIRLTITKGDCFFVKLGKPLMLSKIISVLHQIMNGMHVITDSFIWLIID